MTDNPTTTHGPKVFKIAYRSVGERTADLYFNNLQSIRSYAPFADYEIVIHRIEADPFELAVREMLDIAGDDGILAVDADVQITWPPATSLEWLTQRWPEHVNFSVKDIFRGIVPAGVHWHGPRVVDEMRKLLRSRWHESREAALKFRMRPESTLSLEACRRLGVTPAKTSTPVGNHDFNQWYYDLWGKYLSRGWRDGPRERAWKTDLRMTASLGFATVKQYEARVAMSGLDAALRIKPFPYCRERLRELFYSLGEDKLYPEQKPLG